MIDSADATEALATVARAFDVLIDTVEGGGLSGFDQHGLVEFMQAFESLRNRLSLIDHGVVSEAENRDLARFFCHRRLADLLASSLRISGAEASRRVKAAQAVAARVSMLGQPMAPIRPILAVAQRTGEVSSEQVSIIETALAAVDMRGFDPADIEQGERLLTEHARTFGPKELRMLAKQVVDRIDPDGTRPVEELTAARRRFTMRQHPDGSYVGEFRLTGSTGAKLEAVLSPLAAPRSSTVPDLHGAPRPEADQRPYVQRMHDALDDACSRLLRAGELPDSGGTPATVIVTITHDDLLEQAGYGETTAGTQISTVELLKLAGEADVVPAVLAASGAVLELGRSRRIATKTQTYALIARDGGCSFPGCAHPAPWCERHHIVPWALGGATDLNNLTLLCGYHHDRFLGRGWVCRMSSQGLPEWIPPRYVDRSQRPMINTRMARQHQQSPLVRPAESGTAA